MSEPAAIDATQEPESAALVLARLTDMQARFCVNYVAERNGAKAARDAGYSANAASQIAARLIRRPSIIAALKALERELAESESVTPGQVVGRMRAHALTNPVSLLVKRRHYIVDSEGVQKLDDNGEKAWQWVWKYREPDELSPDQAAIVSAISLNTRHQRDGTVTQTVSYKTIDQARALEGLSKALGLNVESVEHHHSGSVEHKVDAMFSFIASNPAAETTARIGATGGGRRQPITIDQD